MSDDLLQRIQVLQFDNRKEAERLLLGFVRDRFPKLGVSEVQLRPQVISLNSFNGFLTMEDGSRLFFKTHTEDDTTIDEYYNAKLLADAGYPVIQPLHSSTQTGQQLLIYEVIDDPSVFDVAWSIEYEGDKAKLAPLRQAQNLADRHLLGYHKRTLSPQTAIDAAATPIHQLFYHRLVGGRLERFYGPLPGKGENSMSIRLPDNVYPMEKIRSVKWIINGQKYDESLDDIIESAISLLEPGQPGPSVIGHGDAHNGNVFFREADKPPSLLYFDPAFAGRHHPLLDLAKPLFHNVFAMWMYFPQEKARELNISVQRYNGTIEITHDYTLPEVRLMFLRSKVDHTLLPLLQELKSRGELRPDWRRYLKAALFCCPFLTLNLADEDRFPPEITALGLTMAMEMGSESTEVRSRIDQMLDEMERVLAMDSSPPSDRWYR